MSRSYPEEAMLKQGAASLAVAQEASEGASLMLSGGALVFASEKTKTAVLTTDETFAASHAFDLGHVSVAYLKATLTSIAADSETFDDSHLYATVSTIDSRTGESYDSAVANIMSPGLFEVGDATSMPLFVSRFVQVSVEIDDADDDDLLYSGSNFPVVEVAIEVSYL